MRLKVKRVTELESPRSLGKGDAGWGRVGDTKPWAEGDHKADSSQATQRRGVDEQYAKREKTHHWLLTIRAWAELTLFLHPLLVVRVAVPRHFRHGHAGDVADERHFFVLANNEVIRGQVADDFRRH